MITYAVDVAILLALAFFAWRGAKKGLILTLFSLLALFVAYFGAQAVSSNFAEPVSNIIRPSIQLSITEAMTGETADSAGAASAAPETETEDDPAGEEEPEADLSLEQIVALLDSSGLFPGFRSYVEEAVEEKVVEVTTTAAAAVASYLALLIARAVLFALSFVVILLLWFLVSRALDLAFQLPILSAVNTVGGLLFGLVKGVLVLLVLVWFLRLFGVITDENAGPVAQVMTVSGLSRLLGSLLAG